MYRLTFHSGSLSGNTRVIHRRRVVLGRDLSNEVWVDDEGAAPMHAEIIEEGAEVRIRALSSDHALRVNGREGAEFILENDARIEIGRTHIIFTAGGGSPPGLWRTVAWVGLSLLLLIGVGLAMFGRHIPGMLEVWRRPTEPLAPRPMTPTPLPEEKGLSAMEKVAGSPDIDRLNATSAAALRPPSPLPSILTRTDPPPGSGDQLGIDIPTAPLSYEAKPEDFPEFIDAGPEPEAAVDLARALKSAELGRLAEADVQLAQIIAERPDYLQAYAERARLLEKMGQVGKAEEVWARLVQKAGDHPLYATAAEELARLAMRHIGQVPSQPNPPVTFPIQRPTPPPQIPANVTTASAPAVVRPPPATTVTARPPPVVVAPVRPVPPVAAPPLIIRTNPPPPVAAPRPPLTPPPPVAPAPTPPPAPPVKTATLPARVVSFGRIDVRRFPESPGVMDARVMEMEVRALEGLSALADPARVTIKVEFYDQIPHSNAIVPSESTVSMVRMGSSWSPQDTIQFQATYTSTEATLKKAAARGVTAPQYYGYVARLYYDGRLQEERRKPDQLNPSLNRPVRW